MATQTGIQVMCPQTGKPQNCGTWSEYEEGHTGSAAMCNGGIYEGDSYSACPSRTECMEASLASRRHLPVMNQQPTGGTYVTGATPTARMWQPTLQTPRMAPIHAPTWEEVYARHVGGIPTTIPARTSPMMNTQQNVARAPSTSPMMQYPSSPYPSYVPTPVMPPAQFPSAMRSQFAAPIPFHAGGITPTFLPDDDEGIGERLLKNIGQGMIGASGWHVFDLARTVDFFGSRKKH